MTKKQDWEIERDKQREFRQNAMRSLTVEQLQAIHSTYDSLNAAMLSIRDLNDLMLSDIKALDDACCNLYHEFNLSGED